MTKRLFTLLICLVPCEKLSVQVKRNSRMNIFFMQPGIYKLKKEGQMYVIIPQNLFVVKIIFYKMH